LRGEAIGDRDGAADHTAERVDDVPAEALGRAVEALRDLDRRAVEREAGDARNDDPLPAGFERAPERVPTIANATML